MYEFTKKTVEEDVNAMILLARESKNDSECIHVSIGCGDVDGVCGA